MRSQKVLFFLFISIFFLSSSEDTHPLNLLSHFDTNMEKIVIGKLDEDVILPCSFEDESEDTVIHWKIPDIGYVYSYYQDSDHLENQDARYKNRASLFHSEIHNGNASLCLRRLSLQDEGTYTCYVGTTSGKFRQKVVLKVGAFVTPVMKYEKSNSSSILICSILSVYPRPNITWHMDNTPVPDRKVEEIGSLGSFSINSTVNIAEPYSSSECAIENSLFEQTWRGRWTIKDDLHKMQSEQVSFSCDTANNFFLPNQDFIVTWSRIENETSFILAYFVSSSQGIIINEPRLSWKKELINQGDFSSTLNDLRIPDNGEYLCNISSSKYTLLTIQTLHVESYQNRGMTVWTTVIILVAVVVPVLVVVLVWAVKRCKSRNSTHRRAGPENKNHPGKNNSSEEHPMTGSNSEEDG